MYLAELRIENFRIFGEGSQALVLPLRPGLTALVGENDTGKTAVVDALRLVLGTRDHEFFRVDESDFHLPPNGSGATKEIRIRCRFETLTVSDKAAFSEHITYEDTATGKVPVLYVNWKAAVTQTTHLRRFVNVECRSGKAADGPSFEQGAKALLCATYLRPLRDAERAMSAGRGSRLSQILQHTKEVREHGQDYDAVTGQPADANDLSIRGIGDFANALLGKHKGIRAARDNLNIKYLQRLSFAGDKFEGQISVNGSRGDLEARLRTLLEKLDLQLKDGGVAESPPSRGLGSNNILFMACELLLLGSEADAFPLLLVEEPEAHLHPQRQLRLIQFLQQKVIEERPDNQKIQVIISSHSPNLASVVHLDNLVLLHGRKAFPLALGLTGLSKSDYGFLARFLDVTKANLFFARGLLIVEGDAENILFPTLARLIGRDLTEHGVSIINVGGIGLRRFARIYMRSNPAKDGVINVPVACVADFDVLPDCAPEILGHVESADSWPEPTKRKWRAKKDFTVDQLAQRRADIRAKASSQRVETFVADECTFEYDLAYSGLAREVWLAAKLARANERIASGTQRASRTIREALKSYANLLQENLAPDALASHVYALVEGTSKAVVAQYLAGILDNRVRRETLTPELLREALPKYVIDAIEFSTTPAIGSGSAAA